MRSNLWGRITGKDKGQSVPDQQASVLGRIGDYTIVSPYGLWTNLPSNTLLLKVAPGVAIPVTVDRPSDTEQGEPVFFHPGTNTRIIARNNGDLDILTTEGSGNVNIETLNANITAIEDVNVECVNATVAAADVTVDAPLATFTGNVQIDGVLNVTGNITSLANVIATALLQGATLTVTGAGSINGKDFISHTHAQGNDSNGDSQVNTTGVV